MRSFSYSAMILGALKRYGALGYLDLLNAIIPDNCCPEAPAAVARTLKQLRLKGAVEICQIGSRRTKYRLTGDDTI